MSTVTPLTDGRNQRRDRNREAVVRALLELYREGNLGPSADEIAARAGISARSLFRYFDDVDTLVRAAIARQQQHLAPLYELDLAADAPARRADRALRRGTDPAAQRHGRGRAGGPHAGARASR